LRKLSQAEKEFEKIARVDPKNPYPFTGLGEICLHRREFTQARKYFSYAIRHKKDLPSALFGLAQAEFRLKNFKKAKELFYRYQALKALEPKTYYFLGCIYEKEKKFQQAITQYQDAMRLGLNDINVLYRILKISFHIKIRDDIIKYVLRRYKEFKRQLKRSQRLNIKKKGWLKGLGIMKKRMEVMEKILERRFKLQ
jgi:tetratricopeptide (TPR) repeat protein